MTYGVRAAVRSKINKMVGQTLRRRKTANQKVKAAIQKALKPHTATVKGAMKPKILGNFIKPTRMTKMSFEGSWNALCSATNVSVPYVFNLNSIWDPDYSNFTKNTRANGWTLANTLYTDYRVHAAKVTLSFVNRSDRPCYILLTANNDLALQTASSLPSDLLTRPGSYGKICGQLGAKDDKVTISKKYKLYDVEGISQDEYRDSDGTSASMNANPTDKCFCYATISSLPEAFGDVSFGVFNIKIEFDVELIDPKEAASTVV